MTGTDSPMDQLGRRLGQVIADHRADRARAAWRVIEVAVEPDGDRLTLMAYRVLRARWADRRRAAFQVIDGGGAQ